MFAYSPHCRSLGRLGARFPFMRSGLWGTCLLLLTLVISACSPANNPVADGMLPVPGAATEALISHYLSTYAAEFQLEPRPQGSPKAIAEAYLRQYQPGVLPRVFENSTIYDRHGKLLAEVFDEGRRTWVPLSRISPYMLDAVVATEDASFFQNEGIDPKRLVGALVSNTAGGGGLSSGGSTITMQLARMLFLPPEQRFSRSLDRKITEVLLARDLTRLFSKDEILELYLNLAYFGHLSYGPEAAARTYFGKSAADLTLGEATLLAGMPQQPARLDPYFNLDASKERQRIVLDLMVKRGYITANEADAAYADPITLTSDPNNLPKLAPHFIQYLDDYLAKAPKKLNLARAGLTIDTTLDLDMQNLAQKTVRENVDALRAGYDLNNGALVALKPGTAEILAMVGSADYSNERIGGQVNVAVRERQPGSAIKPIVYSTAFDQNLISPATLLWDVQVKYPTAEPGKDYIPKNYDDKFRGPVTVRTALANSLNVPTVKMFDGIEPSVFITTAHDMGITTFNDSSYDRYGLAMALGGTEVSLLDLTTAFHTIANGGLFVEPTPVLTITNSNGERTFIPPSRPPMQAISPQSAFLVTDIISDNDARSLVFGPNSRLKLSRPAAAKTGTTTNFRDNWTMGFTKYLVAGVWAGNNDGHPMRNADGITGAGPIWNKFMEAVLADPAMLKTLGAPEGEEGWAFTPPPGVAQVDRPCPRELHCRAGGEYFSEAWLDHMAAAGPYADSFLTGEMAQVIVQMSNGQTLRPGICVQRLTTPGDPRSQTALVMPRGVGRLSMEWVDAAALAAARTMTVTQPLTGVVMVDAGAPPMLLLNLPFVANGSATDQPISTAAAPTSGQSSVTSREPQLVLFSNDRMRDEQKEVMRWARNNGKSLVWGDCGHAEQWARAVFGNGVKSVTVSAPLPPDRLAVVDDGQAVEADPTATPEAVAADSGPNGIFTPSGGSTVAGTVAVEAAATNPNFWKWQLDLLVNGQNPTFLAVGDKPANAPTALLTWNTTAYPNGNHILRLRVVRHDGNYDEYYTPVTISN